MVRTSAPIVLFDMDGVLVDVSGSYRRAIQETAELFIGRAVLPEEVQRYKNRGGFNDDWRLTEAIIRDSGGNVPFDEIVRSFDLRYRGTAWNGFIATEPPLIPRAVNAVSRRRIHGRVGSTARKKPSPMPTVSTRTFALAEPGSPDGLRRNARLDSDGGRAEGMVERCMAS